MDPKQNNHGLRMYYEGLPTENLKHQALAEQEAFLQILQSVHHYHHVQQKHHAFRQYRLSTDETSEYSVLHHFPEPTYAFRLQHALPDYDLQIVLFQLHH